MRPWLGALLGLLCCAAVSADGLTETRIIAHRGASGYLPEHTLAAKALAHAMGADFLEQDVVLTRDGVPVVLHDIYLQPTTDVARRYPGRQRDDGHFYAIDFTLQELRSLRLHERSSIGKDGVERAVFPGRFPLGEGWETVPTLEEEIRFIDGLNRSRGHSAGLYIELKAPRWHRRQGHDIARAVLDVLVRTGYDSRPEAVYLQCFDDDTLRYLRETLKTPLPLIQLIAENDWGEDSGVDYDFLRTPQGLDAIARYADGIGPWLMQIYQGQGADGAPRFTDLVPQERARGLQVHPYTFRADQLPPGVGSFRELLGLFSGEQRLDALFTDFPDQAKRFLSGH